ncbi:EAL domain-containing protein [Thioalkalicoccus limnaeus]|uniref:EAL domain-containing protein n=1 Tax=Thioalkalicoccus limnaeus TaxID=120681 RepID=A0ABV4BJC2_9GAMM
MTTLHDAQRPLLVYVGACDEVPTYLRAHLDLEACTIAAIAGPNEPLPATPSRCDPILLIDLSALEDEPDLTETVTGLRARFGEGARVFCLTGATAIAEQLGALRAGADGLWPMTGTGTARYEPLTARISELMSDQAVRPRILVVDDQPVAALFATRVLEGAGMEVRALSDPFRVLEVIETFRPDLILMDLHMPGASGTELTRIIRDHDELVATPILFLSGEIDPAIQMDTLRVGGDDFLAKPITPQRLIAAVRDGLARSRDRAARTLAAARDIAWIDPGTFARRIDRIIAASPVGDPTHGLFLIDSEPAAEKAATEPDGRTLPHTTRIAAGLAACLEPTDSLARLPDACFGVLARRPDPRRLRRLGERLREAASEALNRDGRADRYQASIGLATFEVPADDALTMLSRARSALAEARRQAGASLVIQTPATARGRCPAHSAPITALIEQALHDGTGLELFFQPIATLRPMRGEPFDVSVRLRTTSGELIPAFDFLPAADEAGLMPAIDRWVLEQALTAQQRGLNQRPALRLLIQQGRSVLQDANWIQALRDQVLARDLIRHRPILRLSFFDLMTDPATAVDRGEQLRRLGIPICIDHLALSAEALNLATRLRPALVRLRAAPALELASDELSALIHRIHDIGAKVIIASIEDPVAISRVWQAGADLIQGNFVQPPGPTLDFDFAGMVLE